MTEGQADENTGQVLSNTNENKLIKKDLMTSRKFEQSLYVFILFLFSACRDNNESLKIMAVSEADPYHLFCLFL